MPDTILIVDDEDSVRKTLRDWLAEAQLNVELITAGDAEAALGHAQRTPIDLAVLDWNLGAGNDGLHLLEDISVFRPDVVAILVTGYAHQATPLAALRMGVRDYLDKSTDLNRETFVAAVKRQLDKIAPAKKLREWHHALASFRTSVEQVLPLVETSAAMADPLPLPQAGATLCKFIGEVVGAKSAVLLVRITRDGQDETRAYDAAGTPLAGPFAPFGKTLAATALSMGEPCVVPDMASESLGGAELQPFERGKKSLLAAPLAVGSGVSAVLELFDKPSGFSNEDRRLAAAAAAVGTALLEQALGEQKKQKTLFAAVEAALKATDNVDASLRDADRSRSDRTTLPEKVRESLRSTMDRRGGVTLDLAEAVQTLSARHGPEAVRHCLRLVESLTRLLDEMAGPTSPQPKR